MAGLNKACILGNVGKEPEIRSLNSGDRLATFSIATSESWRDKNTGERKEKTEWHNITVWGEGLVGIVEKYVKKGDKLYIEGKIETRKWQDQSGNDKYSTGIVLKGFNAVLQLLSDNRRNGNGGGRDRDQGDAYEQPRAVSGGGGGRSSRDDDLDDQIPF